MNLLSSAIISTMRVITGKAKGTKLVAPKRKATRPATDLVKGAIFSILENLAGDWSCVLDLYSGSGGLGIEALSRGAGWVDFVEHSHECCDVIRQNLEKTKLLGQAHIYSCEVRKAFSFLDKEYGIILIDPPYPDLSIGDIITELSALKLVGKDTILVVTHSPHHSLMKTYGTLRMVKESRHGDSCIAIYRKEAQS
ncbi:MAG: 16S rRNA (guanine(966)-N(2))-methyltransferase RsmD [Chloroflexota bacterium]